LRVNPSERFEPGESVRLVRGSVERHRDGLASASLNNIHETSHFLDLRIVTGRDSDGFQPTDGCLKKKQRHVYFVVRHIMSCQSNAE
jgi:hypothetical protein